MPSVKSIERVNRTSLLFDRSNPNEANLAERSSNQRMPSRNNLKVMSFKELSYTLLS